MTTKAVWGYDGALTCAPGALLAVRHEPAHTHGRWAAADCSTRQRVQADTLGKLLAAAALAGGPYDLAAAGSMECTPDLEFGSFLHALGERLR
eukprot:3693119-Prymnesium_polylepis.1